jgi:hypothetical protein
LTTALSISNIRPVSKEDASIRAGFHVPIYPIGGADRFGIKSFNHGALLNGAVRTLRGAALLWQYRPCDKQAPAGPLLEMIFVS